MKLSVVILLALIVVLGSCVSPTTEPTPAVTPDYDPTPSTSTPPDEVESGIDSLEEWWLKPQSYTYQGELQYMLDESYTVIWWGGRITSPENIRTEIKEEIDRYHAMGIRYIVPISLVDIEDSIDLSVIKEVSSDMIEATVRKLDGTPLVLIENFGGDSEATQYAYDINHPRWRQYVIEQALVAVDAGADGISIDDVGGNRQWVENGLGSFNPASETGFRLYLKEKYSLAQLGELGIADVDIFDYSDYLIERGWTVDNIRLKDYPHHADFPLYDDFYDFQTKATAESISLIIKTAKQYAQEKYSRPLVFTECCEYRDCAAQHIKPYFDILTAGGMYGKQRSFQHMVAYKLGVAVNKSPIVAWLGDTEALFSHYDIPDLYAVYIAEGYASKAQLVGHPGWGHPGEYHDFIFGYADIFNFAGWTSEVSVALLYSLTTMANEEFYSQTHALFFNLGQLLTDSHYQYDILYSRGDDLEVDNLIQHQVIILPQSYRLTAQEKAALLAYTDSGGIIIYVGETQDHSYPFTSQESQQGNIIYNSEWVHISDLYCQHIQYQATHNLALALPQCYQFPSEQPPSMNLEQARTDFQNLLDSHLDKRVTPDTLSENIGLVLWRNEDKLNLHIINYDLDYATGEINERTNLKLMIDATLFTQPSRVSVVSPDFDEDVELAFNVEDGFLTFSVPRLHVWNVVVIE